MDEKNVSGQEKPRCILSLSDATSITLAGYHFFKFGDKPYFPPAAIGMFVRVKLGEDFYIWGRITKVEQVPPYTWHKKNFDIKVHVDRLGDRGIPLSQLSNTPPRQEEIEMYTPRLEAAEKEAPLDVVALKSRFELEVANRKISRADYDLMARKNTELQNVQGNSTVRSIVTEMTRQIQKQNSSQNLDAEFAVEHQRTPSSVPFESLPESGGVFCDTPNRSFAESMTPLNTARTTSSFFNGSMSSTPTPMRTASQTPVGDQCERQIGDQMERFRNSALAGDLHEDAERRAQLTVENRKLNVQARRFAEKYGAKRRSNFDEPNEVLGKKTMWVLNDEQRALKADAYDKMIEEEEQKKEAEKKGDEGKKKGPAAATATPQSYEEAEKKLIASCLDARKSQHISLAVPEEALMLAQQRRSSSRGSFTPTTDEELGRASTGGRPSSLSKPLPPASQLVFSMMCRRSTQLGAKRGREEETAREDVTRNTPLRTEQ